MALAKDDKRRIEFVTQHRDQDNFPEKTDSYKIGHWGMYTEDTEAVWSYFESRIRALYNKMPLIGLQPNLMEHFTGDVLSEKILDESLALLEEHMPEGAVNKDDWWKMFREHDGKLPITIHAVDEGIPVEISNVLMSVVNKYPKKYPWLTNYCETILSHVWYPSGVATRSMECAILMNDYARKTCDNNLHVPYQLHDFGYRGCTCHQQAKLGGMAHLASFGGTDTVPALRGAKQYYFADKAIGHSVFATEHSIMTALGREGEDQLIAKLLNQYHRNILSVVIDSYDYREFIQKTAKFKEIILSRDKALVFRPDSGDPVAVSLEVINMLGDLYGYAFNDKNYKVLPPQVRVIWGDGLNYNKIRNILFTLQNAGWASSNIVFGMGGGLLQDINRDTMRCAFKCSAQLRNGLWVDISKNPLDATKMSKKGRLILLRRGDGSFMTKAVHDGDPIRMDNMLTLKFDEGKLYNVCDFGDIRRNMGVLPESFWNV